MNGNKSSQVYRSIFKISKGNMYLRNKARALPFTNSSLKCAAYSTIKNIFLNTSLESKYTYQKPVANFQIIKKRLAVRMCFHLAENVTQYFGPQKRLV